MIVEKFRISFQYIYPNQAYSMMRTFLIDTISMIVVNKVNKKGFYELKNQTYKQMSSTIPLLNQIAGKLNPTDLNNFLQLFQLALTGSSTQSQKKVFQTLSQVESKPQTYLYFLFIFLNPEYDQALRYITATTMKSTLERNSKELHFDQSIRSLMKTALLSIEIAESQLKSAQNILVSQLAFCFQDIDWQLIYYLVNNIPQNPTILPLLYTIFEDLKHHRENYAYFEGAVQTQVIQALFTKLHVLMCENLAKINFSETQNCINQLKILTDSFKLVRIITFHLPLKLSQYLITYVNELIIPVIRKLSIVLSKQQITGFLAKTSHHVITNFVDAFFESINQIAQTKSQYLLDSNQFMDEFILYFPLSSEEFRKNFQEVCKIWTNTILQLVANDQIQDQNQEQQGCNYYKHQIYSYVQFIIPKVLDGFRFTKQDEVHILQQMELEHNPYNMEEPLNEGQGEGSGDEEGNFEASHGKAHGSTLRKVSIICIEKLSQRYGAVFWEQTRGLFETMLQDESDFRVKQSGIVFVGIVAENCLEEIRDDALAMIRKLVQVKERFSHDIVLASMLWAIEKLIPAFESHTQTKQYMYELIYKVMGNREEYAYLSTAKNLMVKEAAVSLLDQLLSQQTQLSNQVIETMLHCLIYALQLFTGRALFNVFKAISTIFELPQRPGIEPQLVSSAIKSICAKWSVSVSKDSIMCPLIECLSYICENRKQFFVEYSIQILTQIYPLFRETERKSLLLRVIDLATAVIVGAREWPQSEAFKKIREIVSSEQFLLTVDGLILSEEKEVRHFGYGLLSDIVKMKGVADEKAELLIQRIGQSMDRGNSTSVNNALMCLTDMIDQHREVGIKYCGQIQMVIVDFIEKFVSTQLPRIYLLNFARMFGRLAHVDMGVARELVVLRKGILKNLAEGLRSQEKSQLTLSAYRGIVLVLISMGEAVGQIIESKEVEEVLDSFMGYRHNLESSENLDVAKVLFGNLKKLLGTRGISWSQYLNSTKLYPATVSRILEMSN